MLSLVFFFLAPPSNLNRFFASSQLATAESLITGNIIQPHLNDASAIVDPSIIIYMGSSVSHPTMPDNLKGRASAIHPRIKFESFTLATWVITGKSNSTVFNLGRSINDENVGSFNFGINPSGYVVFEDYIHSKALAPFSIVSLKPVNDCIWRHIAFVKSRRKGTIYIDGDIASEKQVSQYVSLSYPSSDFCVAVDCKNVSDHSLHFEGAMDFRLVYDKALSPAEIKYLASISPDLSSPPTNDMLFKNFIQRVHKSLAKRVYASISPLEWVLRNGKFTRGELSFNVHM